MTVTAELEFLTNAQQVAASAAASVALLRKELEALRALSGTKVNVQLPGMPSAPAGVQVGADGRARDSKGRFLGAGAMPPGPIFGGAHSPELVKEHAAAQVRIIEAQAAADAQRSAHKVVEIKTKGANDVARIEAKSAADLAKIDAKHASDMVKMQARAAAAAARASKAAAPRDVLGELGKSFMQGGGIRGAASALGGSGGTLAVAAIDVASTVASAVAGASKMAIDAAEFRRNMLVGLESMTGSAESAQKAYKQVQTIANLTPFETTDVAEFYRVLLGGLKDTTRAGEALKAVSDVAALNNFDTEKAKRISESLAKMAGQGRLTTDTMNELGSASGGIISRGDIYAELAGSTGKSAAAIQKEIEQGKIDASRGYDAIVNTIRKRVSKGELGSLASRMANESVTGLVSTIKGVGFSLLENTDIQPIIKALKNVADTLQGPAGERLAASTSKFFSNLFEAVFGPLGDDTGPERVEKMVNSLADTVDKAAAAVKTATPAVQTFGRALLILGGGTAETPGEKQIQGAITIVSELVKAISPLHFILEGPRNPGRLLQGAFDLAGIDFDISPVTNFIDQVITYLNPINWIRLIKAALSGDAGAVLATPLGQLMSGLTTSVKTEAVAIGTAITDGIASGITGGITSVLTSASNAAQGAIDAAKGVLRTGSPSRAMRDEVGLMAALGMAGGIDRGAPAVVASAADMSNAAIQAAMADPFPMALPPGIAGSTPANVGQASALGGAPIVVNVAIAPGAIVVQGAGDPGAVADAVLAQLDARIEDGIYNAWRRVANGG